MACGLGENRLAIHLLRHAPDLSVAVIDKGLVPRARLSRVPESGAAAQIGP